MTRGPRLSVLAVSLAIAGRALAQEAPLPDPSSFLDACLRNLRSNDLLRSRYTFQDRETRHTRGDDGKPGATQVRIYEVAPSPEPELTYRRLISVNGIQPGDLAARDAEQKRKEQEWLARRELEGLDAREARLRKQEIEDLKEQAVVSEIPSIFDIRMTGRETIDGRSAIVFMFEPRRGSAPRTPQGQIIRHFHGQAWFDEEDHELVRMKTAVLETTSVKFGFIVRLLKGSSGQMERRKIDGEAWLPTYSRFTGSGRVFFVHRIDLDQENEYSMYRKRDPGR